MKKILTLVLTPAILLALVSCGGSASKTTDVLADSNSTKLPVLNPAATTSSPVTTSTEPTASNGIVASPVTTTSAPVTTASGLNPAHGQPGHRCDISVGAPLNSKPTTTTASSTPQIQTVTPQVQNVTVPSVSSSITPTVNSNPTVTAPGMNPAHGQPGHRCEIAVGAPLNSKPTTTTTSPITVQPATKDSTK